LAVRARSRTHKPRQHPYLQPFLKDCVAYHAEVCEALADEFGQRRRLERTVTALVLKGCFLKLAKEKHFLVVDDAQMFADLMKLRRQRPRPSNQIDMWREDHVRVAIDTLLEDIDVDSRVVHKARLAGFYARLHNFRLEILDRDILGQVYQAITSRSARKASGQYYTPPAVVDSLLDSLNLDPRENPDLKICDPACGSGQFLLGVYDHLKARYLESGLDRESAHRAVLERHLVGFDIDPFALALTKMNLFLKEHIHDPVAFNIHQVDTLKREEHELFVQSGASATNAGHFDAVVGNPPWGSKLTTTEKQGLRGAFRSAESGINSFTLFIERALELVRPGGRIGFLIPDAYLNIRAHQSSRELLLDAAAIEQIQICGELFDRVFAPSMILIARREPDARARAANLMRVTHNLGAPDSRSVEIEQARFVDTPESIFNIHLDDGTHALLARIGHGCATLKGHAHFGLGLVTGDNERLVLDCKMTEDHEALIVGKDVEAYRIAPSTRWIVYCRHELQQACPRDIFDATRKLVYRFIGTRLVFACDEEGRLTLNNANVLVPQLPGFHIKYVMALLNSTVIQFVYTFTFFTLKVLRGNLERLPLKYAPEDTQQRIARLTDAIAAETDPERIAQLVEDIDREVTAIYGLSEAEAAFMKRRLAAKLG
jgi:methylase of polypeptide subunit release factors